MGKNKFIEGLDSPYDPDFWANFNIILPIDEFRAIAEVIESSNQAYNIKEEVSDRIWKLPKDKAIRIDSILAIYNEKGLFTGNAFLIARGKDHQPWTCTCFST